MPVYVDWHLTLTIDFWSTVIKFGHGFSRYFWLFRVDRLWTITQNFSVEVREIFGGFKRGDIPQKISLCLTHAGLHNTMSWHKTKVTVTGYNEVRNSQVQPSMTLPELVLGQQTPTQHPVHWTGPGIKKVTCGDSWERKVDVLLWSGITGHPPSSAKSQKEPDRDGRKEMGGSGQPLSIPALSHFRLLGGWLCSHSYSLFLSLCVLFCLLGPCTANRSTKIS